jgi:hypothetical protein
MIHDVGLMGEVLERSERSLYDDATPKPHQATLASYLSMTNHITVRNLLLPFMGQIATIHLQRNIIIS